MSPTSAELEDSLARLLDDRTFQEVDARFHRFNMFEAVGAVRAELRHSNFLAYLLSPSRPHGLGSEVLDRFLRAIVSQIPHERRPIGVLKIIVGDLDTAIVERERYNIDILIEIKAIKLVVVIENKVGSAVSQGQLVGYKRTVREKYHGWRQLFVLLNPDGSRPDNSDHDDDEYFTYSYDDLAVLIAKYLDDRRNTLSAELALVIGNYVDALRRHVVEDNELKETVRQLYARHKEAFDFIFESRPQPDDLLEPLRPIIEDNQAFALDRPGPGLMRFAPIDWMRIDELNSCPPDKWTRTKRNLLFELRAHRNSDRVTISLILGPSDESFRSYVYGEASNRPEIFRGLVKGMGVHTSTIYLRDLLSARTAEELDETEKVVALKAAWDEFVGSDLPLLNTAVRNIAKSRNRESIAPGTN
jgi:PD-(D/E)XK nuclease superfamily